MPGSKKVSVVINTLNRCASLKVTLNALKYQRYPWFEVIVVDGPSKDGTYNYLNENWSDRVKVLSCPSANLSQSRNIGINAASGEIICFIDDDAIPEPDWLERIVPAYEDESVGAVGGWARDNSGVRYQSKTVLSSRDGSSVIDIGNGEIEQFLDSHPTYFQSMIGVNSSFRKVALESIKGWDEEYQYYLDETDVVLRLIEAGWRVKTISEAEVHHKIAPSHIRRDNNVVASYTQVAKSLAYFVLKNAKDESLSTCLNRIENHRKDLINNVNYWFATNMIDATTFHRLLSEINFGIKEGIRDAFQFPVRKLLIKTSNTPKFKSFLSETEICAPKLRIALISDLYPPRPCGGVAVFIAGLAQELARRGHEVTVITLATGEHTVDFENNVWVHRIREDQIGTSRSLERGEVLNEVPDMPDDLARRAKAVLSELDRVNLHRKFQFVLGTIWDLDLAEVIASDRYNVGMYLVTSYKLMEASKPEWKKNQDFYVNHVSKMIKAEMWAVTNCPQIFISTNAILADFEHIYNIKISPTKVIRIPFGMKDVNCVNLQDCRDEIILLFVGRLEKRKGIEVLLKALPNLLQTYKNLKVRIVGKNDILNDKGVTYEDDFKTHHSSEDWFDRVRFLGEIEDSSLLSEYNECDIFVAPSLYESFGLIYLEAMRAGKPCIGCNVGGIPEVIDDGVTGILVEPGSVSSLQNAIAKLVDNEQLRKEMGKLGRTRFEEQFKVEVFASRIEEAISKNIKKFGGVDVD